MPSDLSFRVSTYLTLSLACVCLGVAEWYLLPEVTAFTVFVIALLGVSFAFDRKIELDIHDANVLGLGIAVLAVLWLAVQMSGPPGGAIAQLGWPTSLLPFLGPVLMVLIPAKLFRPKHIGDWWTMHGVGLAAVGLAASMDDQPFFAILLLAYAASASISLVLFYYHRAGGRVTPVPNRPTVENFAVPPQGVETSCLRRLVVQALGWLVVAALLAFPAFFATPRTSGEPWAFARHRIGFSNEPTLDMNRTGDLEPHGGVAFGVTAKHADGSPKEDLPEDQHWRGTSYQIYEGGKWKARAIGIRSFGADWDRAEVAHDPRSFGQDAYSLDFHPSPDSKGLPLASPVFWNDRGHVPVFTQLMSGRKIPWIPHIDGTFHPVQAPETASDILYRQYCRKPDSPGLGEGFEATDPLPKAEAELRNSRLATVHDWSRKRLAKLVDQNKLPRDVLERAEREAVFQIATQDHEPVARAFCDYFASGEDYRYTLRLRRQDRGVDPIEDFLFNIMEGHCERFAAALALSLRSLQIPTQLVLGYRGQEHFGGGRYVVRQKHAHAWVEVLVQRTTRKTDEPGENPQSPVPMKKVLWHWYTLDPTPGGNGPVDHQEKSWLASAQEYGLKLFDDFVTSYNSERRAEAVETTRDFISDWWAAGAIVIVVGWVALRLRRGHRVRGKPIGATTSQSARSPDWFERWKRLSATHGRPLLPGATPREHADALAAEWLVWGRPELADLALFVVSKLYRVRFAGQPLNQQELKGLHDVLDRLETAFEEWEKSGNSLPG